VNAGISVLPDSVFNRVLLGKTVTSLKEHKVHRYLRFGSQAGLISDTAPNAQVTVPAEYVDRLKAILGREGSGQTWIGFAPGSGVAESHKRWPVSSWCSLAERLLNNHPKLNIAIVGGPSEAALLNEVKSGIKSSQERIAVVSESDVMLTAGVLSYCECVVSACSGTLHLAAAVGTRVLGLYGPTNAGFTGPFSERARIIRMELACSPCYRPGFNTGCGRPVCMEMIEPSVVERELELVLRDQFTPMPWTATTDAVKPDMRGVRSVAGAGS
jgi:ADP-heptose:LPS heptosyltransferase